MIHPLADKKKHNRNQRHFISSEVEVVLGLQTPFQTVVNRYP